MIYTNVYLIRHIHVYNKIDTNMYCDVLLMSWSSKFSNNVIFKWPI